MEAELRIVRYNTEMNRLAPVLFRLKDNPDSKIIDNATRKELVRMVQTDQTTGSRIVPQTTHNNAGLYNDAMQALGITAGADGNPELDIRQTFLGLFSGLRNVLPFALNPAARAGQIGRNPRVVFANAEL